MMLFSKLSAIALIVTVAASSGFFYGRKYEQTAALKIAMAAIKTREKINDETSKLGSYDMCLAIGRLPDECDVFLPRLDKTTQSQ